MRSVTIHGFAFGDKHDRLGLIAKLACVRKLLQHRIVSRWLQISYGMAEDRINQASGVPNVEIERDQIAAQMELRIVVQRTAAVIF